MVKFSIVIYFVKDIQASLTFYEKAFGLKPRFVAKSGFYAELATGEVGLAFATEGFAEKALPTDFYKNNPRQAPAGCEIVFTASNVHEALESALKAGATKVADPEVKPWGQTVAYIRDPEGILVELASIMEY